nr:MAG TPA: hypothetical protein [Bacteriophage sp.]
MSLYPSEILILHNEFQVTRLAHQLHHSKNRLDPCL